jgi:NADH-quinone oxidoreductase subunit K
MGEPVLIAYLTLSILLFVLGIWAISVMRKNMLMVLVSVELILLAFNLVLVATSSVFDDIMGQLAALFVLMVAASESAVGLAILVAYYRLTGTLSILSASTLKG